MDGPGWTGAQHREREPFDAELHHLVREVEAALREVDRPSSTGDVTVCPEFLVNGTVVAILLRGETRPDRMIRTRLGRRSR